MSPTRRVLHAHSGNLFGGVETILATLARERGLEPDMEPCVAVCFDGRLADEVRAAGVRVLDLGEARLSRPWTVNRARRRLEDAIRVSRADAVLCHSPWSQAVFGPAIRRSGTPGVLWLHGPVTGRSWLERLARRSPPALTIANSRFTAGTATALYPRTPVETLYAPVVAFDQESAGASAARVRREWDTPDDGVVIIQVSRMEPGKGQANLLRALAELKDTPDWICWVVGGAQRTSEVRYARAMQELARDLAIRDRVRFLGNRTDVPDLLAAADVYCQPNTTPEAFGLTFVEALYAGLPVVATGIGGAVEVVDSSCGILTSSAAPPTVSQALAPLIHSEIARTRLGSAGPARARALCDPARQMARLHEIVTGVTSPDPLRTARQPGGSTDQHPAGPTHPRGEVT